MHDTTLEFALEGEVTLEQFSGAVSHFYELLRQLAQAVAPDTPVQWDLEDLQYGSAVVAVSGRADSKEPILRIVSGFEDVGLALQRHEPIAFPPRVSREAIALINLIGDGDSIRSVRLATARTEVIIYGVFDAQKIGSAKPLVSFGTVKGRVQSISSRRSLRFTIYDAVFDKSVSCYIQEDQRDILTDIWDKVVFVSGRVTRQPDSGQPVSIREITSIDFVPTVEPGNYRKARGILAGHLEPERAEITIRRLRDAES